MSVYFWVGRAYTILMQPTREYTLHTCRNRLTSKYHDIQKHDLIYSEIATVLNMKWPLDVAQWWNRQ